MTFGLLKLTIGSLENYKIWLNNDEPIFIEDKNEGKGIRGSINFFEDKNKEDGYFKKLKELTSSGKKLIFGNAKGHLEENCSALKVFNKDFSSQIEIHHGSLSKEQRESVEKRLKEDYTFSVFCTNTLELGIDIGDIDEVSIIDPPWSVSSFIQKIGRSGRKEDSKIEFSFVLNNLPITSESHICDGLRITLIQSIAIVELMLEGWCEAGRSQTNSYSTFVHQVMSYIAQKRVTTKDDIWSEISVESFPSVVSKDDYEAILDSLLENDYINRDKRNQLILGNKGDKLTEFYDFYSVFFTPDEWTVFSESKNLGTIPLKNVFVEGSTILFSGKKWKVKNADFKDKVLQVIPASDGNPPKFLGTGGMVHEKIHESIKKVLESNEDYKYLSDNSLKYLKSARDTYKQLKSMNTFFPIFKGSGVSNVISFILRTKGYDFDDLGVALYLNDLDSKKVSEVLKEFNSKTKVVELVDETPVEELYFEKYDYLLPKKVLKKSFIETMFEIDGFLEFVKTL